ncbi:MAG: hypothetical protein EAZ61_06865 [Oscillatoriales cyanobacterium]|nr:MAG: hypothetical protein EAZ61_06865 [Oscillatoriales cyanobacterium]
MNKILRYYRSVHRSTAGITTNLRQFQSIGALAWELLIDGDQLTTWINHSITSLVPQAHGYQYDY